MSMEAGAAGAVKIWGLPAMGAAVAAALLFMFLPPRSPREWMVRLSCTLFGSFLFGPLAFVTLAHLAPWIVTGAPTLAASLHVPEWYAQMMLAAPCYVFAGLPTWYVTGGLVRLLERNKHKDAGQMAQGVVDFWKNSK